MKDGLVQITKRRGRIERMHIKPQNGGQIVIYFGDKEIVGQQGKRVLKFTDGVYDPTTQLISYENFKKILRAVSQGQIPEDKMEQIYFELWK